MNEGKKAQTLKIEVEVVFDRPIDPEPIVKTADLVIESVKDCVKVWMSECAESVNGTLKTHLQIIGPGINITGSGS